MVPPEVLERLRGFGASVDRAVPDTLEGVYAVGSLALGDYRPALSNIDVLALADRPWSAAGLAAGRAATAHLGTRHEPARVAFLTWTDLASPDATDSPSAAQGSCFEGRRPRAAHELWNPLSAAVMRSSAICTRGPEYPDLGDGDVRRWAAQRLAGHWSAWAARAGRRPAAQWLRAATTESVLEVTRLSVAVRSGRVVSKLEAGTAALEGSSSRAARILRDAVGFRGGSRTSMYWGPFERKNDALAYIRATVEAVSAGEAG